MNEDIIKSIGSTTINLAAVATSGFSANALCIGHCPNCHKTHNAYVFTNGDEYIMACTHCGFRARGQRGATYFNEWADYEIDMLDRIRAKTKLPLVKKSATARKKAVQLIYC